uniref:Protein E7 n=1 Tax=Florida manatee papillomavirus TaxID=255363 RepID=Q5MFW6_9PAPI|nr:E7 oncoprotein [Florida manatee papillomavirus]
MHGDHATIPDILLEALDLTPHIQEYADSSAFDLLCHENLDDPEVEEVKEQEKAEDSGCARTYYQVESIRGGCDKPVAAVVLATHTGIFSLNENLFTELFFVCLSCAQREGYRNDG